MREGEVGEAAGDRCQSAIGLGKGRVGHGLGTGMGTDWARARARAGRGMDWAWSQAGLGTGLSMDKARAGWARVGHGRAGHGRIVSERHEYPLVIYINSVSLSICDEGFRGWGRETPVKQRVTGVSP